MAKRRASRTHARTRLGDELIRGLTEFRDTLRRGEPIEHRFTVRTVMLDLEPGPYGPAELRSLRNQFEASQAIFAKLLGVSLKTLQSWEQGSPVPAIARRLLDVMTANPAPWRRILRSAATVRKAS